MNYGLQRGIGGAGHGIEERDRCVRVDKISRTAGIPHILEPMGVDREDGQRHKGTTVFFVAWDTTCANTCSKSIVNNSMLMAGATARWAERKRRKYR